MKILTVYYTNEGGGCFKRLCRMIQACLDEGVEVHYISTGKFPLDGDKLYYHGFPGLLRTKRYLFFSAFFMCLPFYMLYIKVKYGIDKIVVFGSEYAFNGILTKLLSGSRIITFIRGDSIIESKSKGHSKLILLVKYMLSYFGLRFSDRIVTVTESLKNILIQRDRVLLGKTMVLYNNIDVSTKKEGGSVKKFTQNMDDNCFVIGFIGKLDPIKNVDILIKSFSQIKDENAMLLIVGEGTERGRLESIVNENKLKDKVVFTGWMNEAWKVLPEIDLIVLPSQYEGSPGVLLEAIAAGIPCVGSDVGGITEILKHKDLLVEASDMRALKNKMEQAINDNRFYSRIKELCAGRKDEFDFDWDSRVVALIKSA